MKRLFFLLQFLLIFSLNNVYAETTESIPAFGYSWNGVNATGSNIYGSAESACSAGVAYYRAAFQTTSNDIGDSGSPSTQVGQSIGVCNASGTNGYKVGWFKTGVTCPTGQNWTLEGANCTRPDCPSGEVLDSSGVCSDKCKAVAGQTSTAWMSAAVGSPSLEGQQYCDNGCSAGVNASPTGTAYVNGKIRLQRYEIVQLGFTCSSGPSLPGSVSPDKTPPEPPKKPPCAATEGVLTSSAGTVACVPPGTPSAEAPAVTKTKNTEAFPDGSTKTTETTTTRDKQTGAEDKTTTTTSTPNSSGGQGQAGPVGTSTTQGSSSSTTGGDPTKPGDSDFCAKNPNLQICKGGMSEEATQKKVQEAAEKIRDSLDAKDFDAATHFKPIALSEEGKAKIDEAIGKMNADIAKFGTSADPSSGFYDNFKNQMTDWIGPISNAGCQPFSGRIGPYTWNLDHCPTAAKISAIGAYCMWVMLAFGVFALTTRNRS